METERYTEIFVVNRRMIRRSTAPPERTKNPSAIGADRRRAWHFDTLSELA
jgi:hypothetical protein